LGDFDGNVWGSWNQENPPYGKRTSPTADEKRPKNRVIKLLACRGKKERDAIRGLTMGQKNRSKGKKTWARVERGSSTKKKKQVERGLDPQIQKLERVFLRFREKRTPAKGKPRGK